MPQPNIKARIARMFLNFLDEHGDYRTQLEEAAARAAAASANDVANQWAKSVMAKERGGRKKKRKRGGGDGSLSNGEEEWEEELEELPSLDSISGNNPDPDYIDYSAYTNGKYSKLPEDPYEQIQFYFHTFRTRTYLQIQQSMNSYQILAREWIHEELHHEKHVPLLSLAMFAGTSLAYGMRRRNKRIKRIQRLHGILGKKFDSSVMRGYLHPNFVRGLILHECTSEGLAEIQKLTEKASKAEEAAMAAMRPYKRKKYERLERLERWGERVVNAWLIVGILASGLVLVITVGNLLKLGQAGLAIDFEDTNVDGMNSNDVLDGHIYSLDGPLDSDGYLIGMREQAEENYADCLLEAETRGVKDPTEECDLDSFFQGESSQENTSSDGAAGSTMSSPIRQQMRTILTTIGIPTPITMYLTSLTSQTLAYISSLLSFFLFLLSHYISHKIHIVALQNNPMQHVVLIDETVKPDGTVEAKRGETEAQRKRRERMLQNERLKAKMAQLAMEAKQRVEARRRRLEGEEKVQREEEEKIKKEKEEQEEVVKLHGRQFMMIKAGVPEEAILNSFSIEGVEDDEAKEILEKLKEIKVRRAEEKMKEEEAEEERKRKEVDAEKEKERVAEERLKRMKSKSCSFGGVPPLPQSQYPAPVPLIRKKSASSVSTSASASFSSINDGGSAKSQLLGEIGSVRKNKEKRSSSPSSTISASISITSSKKEDDSVSKGNIIDGTGTFNVGAGRDLQKANSLGKSGSSDSNHKRLFNPGDTEVPSKAASLLTPISSSSSNSSVTDKANANGTPKKSNIIDGNGNGKDKSQEFSRKTTKSSRRDSHEDHTEGEEKKRDETELHPPCLPVEVDEKKRKMEKLATEASEREECTMSPPVVSRTSYTIQSNNSGPFTVNSHSTTLTFGAPSAWDRRPSARDIQAQIQAVEDAPNHDPTTTLLSNDAYQSPGFEMAVKSSNSSWDRRPSSRDIMAKIKETEDFEAAMASVEEEKAAKRAVILRARMRRANSKNEAEDAGDASALAIIEEDRKIEPATSFEVRIQEGKNRKGKANNAVGDDDSDGSISELSMTTYEDQSLDNSSSKRLIPTNLFLPSEAGRSKVPFSPAWTSSPNALCLQSGKAITPDKAQNILQMAESGHLNFPKIPIIEREGNNNVKTDCSSVKSDVNSCGSKCGSSSDVKVESEEEKLRKRKAEARAKKLEAMAARRRVGREDGTVASGISKSHRLRRKKSALAAISPEEKEKNEWKKGVFQNVMNAEQIKWTRTVFSLVLSSEETQRLNSSRQCEIDEMNEAAQRRKENRSRLEEKAKKFAERAKKFHQLRKEGTSDHGSVVSSASKLKRRRGRKSSAKPVQTILESLPTVNMVYQDEEDRKKWKLQIFASVFDSERVKWKSQIYCFIVNSQSCRSDREQLMVRLEKESKIANEMRMLEKLKAEKLKKFTARAKRFEQQRAADAGDIDDKTLSMSTTLRRRIRRSKKCSAVSKDEKFDDKNDCFSSGSNPLQVTDRNEKETWCNDVYVHVLDADKKYWKKNVFRYVIQSEEKLETRLDLEAQLQIQRTAAEARKEKEKYNQLRAKKMDLIKETRRVLASGRENVDPGCAHSVASIGNASMKKMRDRRKKAALARKANKS